MGGGGIESIGTLIINNSTISGNGAIGGHDGQPWGQGGGIAGNVTFNNSTLSGNYASLSGGGMVGGGAISNSTLSDNRGGGISVSAALEIGNTVVKAGVSGPNIAIDGGTLISHGYNVSSDDGGGYLKDLAIRLTPTHFLVLCRIMAAQHSLTLCCRQPRYRRRRSKFYSATSVRPAGRSFHSRIQRPR